MQQKVPVEVDNDVNFEKHDTEYVFQSLDCQILGRSVDKKLSRKFHVAHRKWNTIYPQPFDCIRIEI